MTERWLPVVDAPGYEVSDLGRFRNSGTGKILSTYPNRYGHHLLGLPINGKHITTSAHKHVLNAFFGPRPYGMVACHNDGVPSNNTLSNLRWDTPKANSADMVRHGTIVRGEKQGHSILTDAKVRLARELDAKGLTHAEIAKTVRASYSSVNQAIIGKTWKHIPLTTKPRNPVFRAMKGGDKTGKRFGKLSVRGLSHMEIAANGRHSSVWICQCDCGTLKQITNGSLLAGTKSCGCLHPSVVWKARKTECRA